MAVVLFDHQDTGSHLSRQRVHRHLVVRQLERGVGVPQTVENAVLACCGVNE